MSTDIRKLYAFAHTHWDREWYQPFETFRAQLLNMVRYLLPRLQAGDIPKFYMDGQAIILEDVVEIEPGLADTISELMRSGKLSAGPWYVLPDEMLVSGESLIRNLALGLKVTRRFGEPMMVGYCPDTFGHSQDLPNILNGFGIKNAIVWRGAPLLEMGPLFRWRSPDGSEVLSYHLTRGYYQTAFHEIVPALSDPKAIVDFSQSLQSWVGLGSGTNGGANPYFHLIGGALLPIGADHVAPPAELRQLIQRVNDIARDRNLDFEVESITLAEFMQSVASKLQSATGINLVQEVDGELRFNRAAPFHERAYLLPGVLSTRLYLKRANHLTEWRLARICEPIQSLICLAGRGKPMCGELEYAWKLLLKNHPHDSICGCSVDAVHDEMQTRTAKLNDLIDSMLDRCAADASGRAGTDPRSHLDPDLLHDRVTVFNTSTQTVSAPVPMRWMQPVGDKRFERMQGTVQFVSKQKVDQLFSGWGAVPYYKDVEVCEGWVWAEDVPALGYRSFDWGKSSDSVTSAAAHAPVTASTNRLSNGHLTVAVSANGKLTVTHRAGKSKTKEYQLRHRIQDVGDGGDTYNFDPLPEDRPIEARLTSVKSGKKGPLIGSLILTYEIDIPESAVRELNPLVSNDSRDPRIELLRRSRTKLKHEITVELSLKRGVPILFFDASWDNRSRDHRLEVVFDTGQKVKSSYSENHLSVLRRYHNLRGLKEKLPVPPGCEAHPDRFPAQRFVVANGQVFLNTGMPEYGVHDTTLSLTMLRAVGVLSKGPLWTRGGGAGPHLSVPGANCLGPNKCSYAWAPLLVPFSDITGSGTGDQWVAEAYSLAEQYEGTTWAALGLGRFDASGQGADAKSMIHLDSKHVRIGACYPDSDNSVVIRLLNVRADDEAVRAHFNCDFKSIEMVNYAGEKVGEVLLTRTEACQVADLIFGAHEVKTLRLTLA